MGKIFIISIFLALISLSLVSSINGSFNFGYQDIANFTGAYNSSTHLMGGQIRWNIGQNASYKWVGSGLYIPLTNSSGLMYITFEDILNPSDPGISWTGNYNSTYWSLSNMNNFSQTIQGVVYDPII